MTRNALIRIFGWPAVVAQGDVLFAERVGWLWRRLQRGKVRTLDAGCGVGGLSMLAARAGNEVLGLTFSAADAELAGRRAALVGAGSARFEVVDLRELGGHLGRLGLFDQVIACEVIEHLRDDDALIVNLAALLRPGGRLFLTTPYLRHRPVYGERVSESEDGGHVRFGYTHERLTELFAAAGLGVVEAGFLNGFFAQKLFSVYLRSYRVHPKLGWLLTLPLRPLCVFDGVVSRLTGYPSMSVTVVGVKAGGAA